MVIFIIHKNLIDIIPVVTIEIKTQKMRIKYEKMKKKINLMEKGP